MARDRPEVLAGVAGVWIRELTVKPIPWSEIRSVSLGVFYEANSAICFDLVDGPMRREIFAKRKDQKTIDLIHDPCDFYFLVPMGKNPKHVLSQMREFMVSARGETKGTECN